MRELLLDECLAVSGGDVGDDYSEPAPDVPPVTVENLAPPPGSGCPVNNGSGLGSCSNTPSPFYDNPGLDAGDVVAPPNTNLDNGIDLGSEPKPAPTKIQA